MPKKHTQFNDQKSHENLSVNPNSEMRPSRTLAVIMSALVIGGLVFGGFSFKSFLENKTDEGLYVQQKKKEAEDLSNLEKIVIGKIFAENQKYGFTTLLENKKIRYSNYSNKKFQATFVTNFGDLRFNLDANIIPKNVENIVRLLDRGYYNKTIFHRVVKQPGFGVIQAGDRENSNGTGGQSAYYINKDSENSLEDELWKIEPEFGVINPENQLDNVDPLESIINNPEFNNPNWLTGFDSKTGLVTYKKGLLVMANKGSKTNSSQFFVTLTDSTMPANYTIIGEVDPSSATLLDKINSEVNVQQTTPENNIALKKNDPSKFEGDVIVDGFPTPELVIISAGVEITQN
jgi:cyclophilin family peptidyl-prolyl cis-trans isomerase